MSASMIPMSCSARVWESCLKARCIDLNALAPFYKRAVNIVTPDETGQGRIGGTETVTVPVTGVAAGLRYWHTDRATLTRLIMTRPGHRGPLFSESSAGL